MNTTAKRTIAAVLLTLTLSQCDTTKSDLEGIAKQNTVIMKEQPGNYFVARRYHVPGTRFWGYVRTPRTPWAKADLVLMDEELCPTPDRGPEDGPNKTYGRDQNYEYILYGNYTGRYAYDPNSNQKLKVFRAKKYQLRNADPGWLFKPSERYSTKEVSIRPAIIPATARVQ